MMQYNSQNFLTRIPGVGVPSEMKAQSTPHEYGSYSGDQEQTRKDKRISLRISGIDLGHLKTIAATEGLPYQTLITSILHKFILNRKTNEEAA